MLLLKCFVGFKQVKELWIPFTLESDSALLWQCGPLDLYVKRQNTDWVLGSHYVSDDEDLNRSGIQYGVETFPPEIRWVRWSLQKEVETAQFLPVMTERPLLVGVRNPLMLPEKGKVLYFMSIPVWVQLKVGKKKAVFFDAIPTVQMSDTWFGDQFSGELCYALHSKARRDLKSLLILPHRAICPMMICNTVSIPLECKKFSFKAKYLNIYESEGSLWSSRVNVDYHGGEKYSQIRYENTVPDEAKAGELLLKAQFNAPKKFFRKMFGV